MLDIAWPELLVIGAVALVAIGPKDLPKVMHMLGKWAGKARGFAHDIHRTLEQASYEAEIAEKLKNSPPSTPLQPEREAQTKPSDPSSHTPPPHAGPYA
jgi:Tat protein translocase TatB subunit